MQGMRCTMAGGEGWEERGRLPACIWLECPPPSHASANSSLKQPISFYRRRVLLFSMQSMLYRGIVAGVSLTSVTAEEGVG